MTEIEHNFGEASAKVTGYVPRQGYFVKDIEKAKADDSLLCNHEVDKLMSEWKTLTSVFKTVKDTCDATGRGGEEVVCGRKNLDNRIFQKLQEYFRDNNNAAVLGEGGVGPEDAFTELNNVDDRIHSSESEPSSDDDADNGGVGSSSGVGSSRGQNASAKGGKWISGYSGNSSIFRPSSTPAVQRRRTMSSSSSSHKKSSKKGQGLEEVMAQATFAIIKLMERSEEREIRREEERRRKEQMMMMNFHNCNPSHFGMTPLGMSNMMQGNMGVMQGIFGFMQGGMGNMGVHAHSTMHCNIGITGTSPFDVRVAFQPLPDGGINKPNEADSNVVEGKANVDMDPNDVATNSGGMDSNIIRDYED
ncbi:hypothetical protein HDU76_010570 [Blyttiomyces sp. JEL0837]|nr:hypothetical protein HDU76_010570 [Blyttiomyces sp. JEL0837]